MEYAVLVINAMDNAIVNHDLRRLVLLLVVKRGYVDQGLLHDATRDDVECLAETRGV